MSERMREDHAKLGLAAHDGAVRVDVDRLQNTVINRAGAGGPEGARRPERQSVLDAADAGARQARAVQEGTALSGCDSHVRRHPRPGSALHRTTVRLASARAAATRPWRPLRRRRCAAEARVCASCAGPDGAAPTPPVGAATRHSMLPAAQVRRNNRRSNARATNRAARPGDAGIGRPWARRGRRPWRRQRPPSPVPPQAPRRRS